MSDALQTEIGKVDARLSELQERHANAETELVELRDQLSEKIAEGADTGKVHSRIAKVTAERDAIPSAIDRLKQRQRELKAQAVEQKRDRELAELDDAAERLRPLFAEASQALHRVAEAASGQFASPPAGMNTSFAALATALGNHVDNIANAEKARIQFAAHTRAAGWRKAEQDETVPQPSTRPAEAVLNMPEGRPDNRYL